MNCNDARKRWHLRFDDGGADRALDEHLGRCAACRAYAAQMSDLCAALERIRDETEAAPENAAHSQAAPRQTGWIIRLAPGIAAAAMIALALLAYRPGIAPPTKDSPVATPATEGPALGITLKDESKSRLIAVATATGNPDVQMYRLYPRLSAVSAVSP